MLGRFIKGPSERRAEQPAPALWRRLQRNCSGADIDRNGDEFLTLKVDLHRHLIERFNLDAF